MISPYQLMQQITIEMSELRRTFSKETEEKILKLINSSETYPNMSAYQIEQSRMQLLDIYLSNNIYGNAYDLCTLILSINPKAHVIKKLNKLEKMKESLSDEFIYSSDINLIDSSLCFCPPRDNSCEYDEEFETMIEERLSKLDDQSQKSFYKNRDCRRGDDILSGEDLDVLTLESLERSNNFRNAEHKYDEVLMEDSLALKEILLLNYADGKNTSLSFPLYWSATYHINVSSVIEKLLKFDFLKNDNKYSATDKGRNIIENNQHLIYCHKYRNLFDFSLEDIDSEKKAHPELSKYDLAIRLVEKNKLNNLKSQAYGRYRNDFYIQSEIYSHSGDFKHSIYNLLKVCYLDLTICAFENAPDFAPRVISNLNSMLKKSNTSILDYRDYFYALRFPCVPETLSSKANFDKICAALDDFNNPVQFI